MPADAFLLALDGADTIDVCRANTKVYALVASLLVKIGKRMGRKRGAEWEVMLSRLREQHARKRNFIQELDRVAKSPLDVARQRRSERR